jgi:thiol:disulfide interchange protein DsbD
MPCVFPVLAMKAAAFARLAGHERSAMRRDGLAYTAGVLVAFAAMAAVVVAIRASVGEVSWGFQFQSPIFSLLIAYLFFVIGLNLAGVFEIGGASPAWARACRARRRDRRLLHRRAGGGRGDALHRAVHGRGAGLCAQPARAADRGGAAGDGPRPRPALSRAVDDARLQRLMPRPGPWMDRLRQFLAFPMFASAVWMIWVLTQQTGPDGVIYALGGMILIAFAIWLLRLGQARRLDRHLAAPRRGGGAVLLAFAAVLKLAGRPATAASASGGPGSGVNFEGWERFSRARMTEAAARRQAGVRRFHRRLVHHLPGERAGGAGDAGDAQAFEQTGTVKLKGDWTNRDPEITSLLKELGRAGVPLYLYWAPGATSQRSCRRC